MSDNKMEKIYLAVQDIRTLAARARPECSDSRDCIGCPAIIALSDRRGIACLFDIVQHEGKTMKESMKKILCCVCRKPMVRILSGSGEKKRWRCMTPGCVINEYAQRKNRSFLQEI